MPGEVRKLRKQTIALFILVFVHQQFAWFAKRVSAALSWCHVECCEASKVVVGGAEVSEVILASGLVSAVK